MDCPKVKAINSSFILAIWEPVSLLIIVLSLHFGFVKVEALS